MSIQLPALNVQILPQDGPKVPGKTRQGRCGSVLVPLQALCVQMHSRLLWEAGCWQCSTLDSPFCANALGVLYLVPSHITVSVLQVLRRVFLLGHRLGKATRAIRVARGLCWRTA